MLSNSSSVPRRIFRNNGMSPMPSGSSRMTSSVTPGRMVGLIMPTTPRQLENAIVPIPEVVLAKARTHAPCPLVRLRRMGPGSTAGTTQVLSAIFLLRRVGRDIAFGQIAGKRGGVAVAWIAVAAAAGALQEEALAGRHLDPGRGLGLEFLLGAEPHHEARAGAGLAAGEAAGREAGLVEAADDGRAFQ